MGLNYEHHRLIIDMSELGEPEEDDEVGIMKFDNYMLTAGYGYNLVLPHGWTIGASDGVSFGVTHGRSSGYREHASPGVSNNFRLGLGCNQRRWFANFTLNSRLCWYGEDDFKMSSHYFTATLSAGVRFNLW